MKTSTYSKTQWSTSAAALAMVLLTAFSQPASALDGQWTPTAPMTYTHESFSVYGQPLPGGKVLLSSGLGPVSVAEIYDPSTGTWAPTGAPATGRSYAASVALNDGKVMIVGGLVGYIFEWTSTAGVEVYNPLTGLWTATTSMSIDRYGHTLTKLSNGKVMAASGIGSSGGIRSSVEVYDPATQAWYPSAPMTGPRANHTATLLADGKVLLAGGVDATNVTSRAEIYDPATGTSTLVASLPEPVTSQAAIRLPDGRVMVAGGNLAGVVGSSNKVHIFDVQTQTWSPTGSLNVARQLLSLNFSPNGKILAFGGYNSALSGYVTAADVYDMTSGVWTATTSVASQNRRQGHAALNLPDGGILVAGFAPYTQNIGEIYKQNSTYQFSGFFQPVDSLPTMNSVKAGSAIPVKFSLGLYAGLNVFEAGSPKSQQIACSSATVDAVEETSAAGSSSLTYDVTSGRYHYIWKTEKSWAGTCRQLILNFDEGSSQRANFLFK